MLLMIFLMILLSVGDGDHLLFQLLLCLQATLGQLISFDDDVNDVADVGGVGGVADATDVAGVAGVADVTGVADVDDVNDDADVARVSGGEPLPGFSTSPDSLGCSG